MGIAPILILGYGNPLRGDDSLGRLAASQLARRFAAREDVQVETVHQLTLDLAELVAGRGLVILLDAREGEPAGGIFCEPVTASDGAPDPLSHYCTPGQLLAATRLLYGAEPRAWLAGITTQAFAAGADLSPPTAEALPALLARVATLVYGEPPQRAGG